MIETDVSPDQADRLIERHFEIVLNGIITRKEGEALARIP